MFNEAEVVDQFCQRATRALASIPDSSVEIIFVDDGSTDASFNVLSKQASSKSGIKLVRLSRNFGHQIAITAGIDHAAGDCIVTIDADLQDPPEVIPEMVAKWREGFDVVYGLRRSRAGERVLKRLTASIFYRLLNSISRLQIPPDVGDFRLISRRVADALAGMREKDRYIRGLITWVGFRQTAVEYDRAKREGGETKFPYTSMFRFAFDGITSFSTAPLKLATWLGYATSILAFIYLVSVFVQKMLGQTIQGWATIMVAVLFMGGVQLICLGILGEYLGRVFTEIKPRPMYIVDEVIQGSMQETAAQSPRRDHDTSDSVA